MAGNKDNVTLVATSVPVGSSVVLVVSKGALDMMPANAVVPDVLGMQQSEALAAMQGIGANAQFFTQHSDDYKRGEVMAQWPEAGAVTSSGTSAAVLVSAGPAAEGTGMVGVPHVVGQTDASAQLMIEQSSLKPVIVRVTSATVAEGIVLAQLPEERTTVAKKSSKAWIWIAAVAAIALVGLGAFMFMNANSTPTAPTQATVPNLVGKSGAEADVILSEANLTLGSMREVETSTVDAGTIISQDPTAGAKVDEGSRVNIVVAAASQLVPVPDVVGVTRDAATQDIAAAGLKASVTEAASDKVPKGTVISQTPKAGQQVPAGTEVGLVVSSGPTQSNVKVPGVVGMTESAAITAIEGASLVVRSIQTYSATVPTGKVIGQAPSAGASVAKGTEIAILVSLGPDPSSATNVKVPNVVGLTVDDATSQLQAAGFEVTQFPMNGSGQPADQVLYQTPAGGKSAPQGSQIVLVISSGM